MLVSRNSWHYRIYNLLQNFWHRGPVLVIDLVDSDTHFYLHTHYPKSLCRYFWAIVFMVIGSPLLLLATVILSIVGVIFIACLYLGEFVFTPLWQKLFPKKVKKGKTPNLLVSFVKAKKSRVCPMITLID